MLDESEWLGDDWRGLRSVDRVRYKQVILIQVYPRGVFLYDCFVKLHGNGIVQPTPTTNFQIYGHVVVLSAQMKLLSLAVTLM